MPDAPPPPLELCVCVTVDDCVTGVWAEDGVDDWVCVAETVAVELCDCVDDCVAGVWACDRVRVSDGVFVLVSDCDLLPVVVRLLVRVAVLVWVCERVCDWVMVPVSVGVAVRETSAALALCVSVGA